MTKNNEEMTDKQIMECKYKFQSIEKFAGKPYCTLHNETCEFINFVCDNNCQVYEDYKQLKRKEQECEELKKQLESTKGLVTVGNRQLAEALLELQKYQDNEQQEKELQKLYNKFNGNSLIEKCNSAKNKRGGR